MEESEMSISESDADMMVDETLSEQVDEDLVPFLDGIWYRRHDGDSITLLLEIGKKVYFSGKAILQGVKGRVEILGHVLTGGSSPQKIFSPKGHSSLLYIEGKEAGEDFEGNIYPDGFSVVVLRAFENQWTCGLRNTASNGDVLVGPEIHIKNNTLHPRLAGDLKNVQTRLKLPKMKYFLDKFGFQLVPEKLLEKNKLFVTEPAWDQFLDKMATDRKNAGAFAIPEKICVFGGKGVGKSTFCRWLTNRLLQQDHIDGQQQVLYIDLDPGQTEFNPPGIISLHLVSNPLLGPNFSHLRHPEKGVFLGGVNVADIPLSYLQGVTDLARFAEENYANIPWIINTMGFSSGLGIPLAISVIKIFRPSNLLQLTISNNPKSSFPFDLNPNNIATYKAPHFLMSNALLNLTQIWNNGLIYNFTRIDSVFAKSMNSLDNNSDYKNTPGNNPKSLREAMLISYFSELIGSTPEQSLPSVRPYHIKLHGLTIGCMDSNLNWEGILSAIVGNLVALCWIPREDDESNADEQSEELAQRVPDSSNSDNDTLSSTQEEDEDEDDQSSSNNGRLPLGSSTVFMPNCSSLQNVSYLGYGLCRGHQKKTDELLIITPLSSVQLDKVNIIICAGEVGLPVCLLSHKNKGHSRSYISGSQLNAGGKKYFIPGKKSTHNSIK